MDKVVLPKEVAEAIKERQLTFGNEGTAFLMNELSSSLYCNIPQWIDKEKGNLTKLAQAIEYGYEVELTPEEKILSKYKAYQPYSDYGNAYRQGVRDTLNAYGNKIEGVNV